MPGFHPRGARLPPQQLYYGQGAHGFPPQPTYGFQQQLLPGIRPGIGPNFILPYPLQRQGQPGQRVGPRRGGTSQQMQHQQQQFQRNANQGYRYMSNVRNGLDPSMVPRGLMNPMVAMPFDLSGMYVSPGDGQQPGPMPISALASALASASPERQREVENAGNRYPILRRRRRLPVVQEIIKAGRMDSQVARFSGFALLTAMPLSDTVEFLKSGQIQATEFDALIFGSGGDVYYPDISKEEGGKICSDPDYGSQTDYRWGSEGLKKTLWKLMNTREGRLDKPEQSTSPIEEDVKSSSAHCLSYLIKDPTKARRVDNLRQKLRMRGLRCHLMYCRNSTRMQVIPLLASRAQALRYLFVRWGLNVANMYVILGETGDTDYEELISGTHKTLIMKEMVKKGSEELLRTTGSYVKDDIVPGGSPLVAYTNSEAKAEEISNILKELSKASI